MSYPCASMFHSDKILYITWLWLWIHVQYENIGKTLICIIHLHVMLEQIWEHQSGDAADRPLVLS